MINTLNSSPLGFLSVDALVVVPPSCMNADEDGRPKTALYGDSVRLRWSSQSQKRAWRTSSNFAGMDHSLRTREQPGEIYRKLVDKRVATKLAAEVAHAIGEKFGSIDGKKTQPDKMRHSEVVVYEPEELTAIEAVIDDVAKSGKAPDEAALDALARSGTGVDVALFGRMRAAQKSLSVDAACAVGHAISATRTRVEADYWSAVDDLNVGAAESGSAHINERSLASGVMYQHVDIDLGSLVKNLNGDKACAQAAVEALIRSVAGVHPAAGRSQFGTNLVADYLRVTRTQQPVSLVAAFETPAKDLAGAVTQLTERARQIQSAFAIPSEARELRLGANGASLQDILQFARDAVR